MKKRLIAALVMAVLAAALVPGTAWATSTVSGTLYGSALKSGNAVYCPSPGFGIFKATVKNGKVTSKKWLVKEKYAPPWEGSYITGMRKRGGYLYYISLTEGTVSYLERVKIKTGKTSLVCECVTGYAFKGKKIYAEIMNPDTGKFSYRVMKLNGKSKKKTSVKPKVTYKENPNGYKTVYETHGKYIMTYLKTSKGKYYLGKVKTVGE